MPPSTSWRNWGDHPGYVALTAIASVIGVVIGVVATLNTSPRTHLPDVSQSTYRSPAIVPPASFANFGNIWPTVNTGGEWQVFNDNKFLGRSSAWYETATHSEALDDYVLRIHYSLRRGPRALAADAYAGIYIDFNPFFGTADLSRYSAMQFAARLGEQATSAQLHYYVNLANPGINDYAYHEYDFTAMLRGDRRFSKLVVPFSVLRQPDWSRDRTHPFDSTTVYRLSFFIKGIVGGDGYLDIDDITFINAPPE